MSEYRILTGREGMKRMEEVMRQYNLYNMLHYSLSTGNTDMVTALQIALSIKSKNQTIHKLNLEY